MKYVSLGRTGLKVSQVALGGLFAADAHDAPRHAADVVRRAVDLGVNYIDTAPGYGDSERVLGEAIGQLPADRPLILSTKLGGRPQPFDPRDKDALIGSVETSLRQLGRDHIDILFVHEPDRPGVYDWWTDWRDLAGPVLDVLEGLKRRGLIGHTGLGGTTTTELAHLCRTGLFDVVLTAFNYSLLWREAAIDTITAAAAHDMGIVIGSPLQQGALAHRYDDTINDAGVHWLSTPRREQFRQLYRLLDATGLDLPEIAMRFVISNPQVHCVLMGARSPREVEQNVAAIEKGPLPDDLLAQLDEIAAAVPFRPFNEPFGIGWHLPAPGGYRGPGPPC